ncbi:DNA cytosine methyltransferase [Paenibacillus oenotherae]|uniref:DNA (cytosine-5-)-methyltransferase n=1 Tax=Paenibacillus oenotherae TaxID=1435645 RepID=A0ABS7D7L6_9BACL|nr:DNA cytosine methyltransferase [Paenibacillus oenotherae]MBW7475927.1 DNA cytosine methyltransferase [Paenibacillus oenotherae]
MQEIIIDNFAGGGGASTGAEKATGRSVDVAINHDEPAIVMHEANHPETKHYCESVWDVDPRVVVAGRKVGLAWFSPDCTHHSKARGGKPRQKNIRGLAWVAVRWAATVQPRVIILENVEEFQDWGPLDKNGHPIKARRGHTFQSFVNALRRQGYEVEWKELTASDFGAPTSRTRLFLIARCDGKPIVWPLPTHAHRRSPAVAARLLEPYKPSSGIIDWTIPCKSIFGRERPLADKTMRRLALGTYKFVINDSDPFIVPDEHIHPWMQEIDEGNASVVSAFLSTYYGETKAGKARGSSLHDPLHTITAGGNRFALVTSHLTKFRGTNIGSSLKDPLPTITAGGQHLGQVYAFLTMYYGTGVGQDLREPINTIVTKDRFGLVLIRGIAYQIVDICMRMLTPRELYRGQGFPESYIINPIYQGKHFPIKQQVAKVGNSVSPVMSEVLVRANLPELCTGSGNTLAFERYTAAAAGQLQLSM